MVGDSVGQRAGTVLPISIARLAQLGELIEVGSCAADGCERTAPIAHVALTAPAELTALAEQTAHVVPIGPRGRRLHTRRRLHSWT